MLSDITNHNEVENVEFINSKILHDDFSPSDLKLLSTDKLHLLCNEIRNYLLKVLNISGGHFGSNLGTVELTVALHYVFDLPKDSIVWDAGHQTYPHKILTERMKQLSTIRKRNGLAPFPAQYESKYDAFGAGHTGTSISATLGIATANYLEKNNNHAIAIIGDAALTGGIAFEALFHAVDTKSNIIIILNDNDMSISESVGGLHHYLKKLNSHDNKVESIFESIGYKYTGILDGHNIDLLVQTLKNAKLYNGPQFIHVKTVKGKGFSLAEKDIASRIKYHAVSPNYLNAVNKINLENITRN